MSDDEGYVHDPTAFDADGEKREERSGPTDASAAAERADRADENEASLTAVQPTAVDRTFGWRGWVLVGVIVLAFVVAPLSIYVLTPEAEVYLMALIILPLFPAIVLGLTAVWATTRP